MTATTLVKPCATCGTDNLPTAQRCACGAFLIGVDVVERELAAPASEAATPVEVTAAPAAAASGPRHVKLCPGCGAENAPTVQRCACGTILLGIDVVEIGHPEPAVPVPGDLPADAAPAGLTDAPAPSAAASLSPSPSVADGLILCPHTDCGQPNPPGTAHCLYCNRRLPTVTAGGAPEPTAASDATPSGATASAAAGAAAGAFAPAVATGASGATAPRRSLISLPTAIASRFEILEQMKAGGGEAELFIVRALNDADRATVGADTAVLKLYRHGIEPKTAVLKRISESSPRHVVRVIEFGASDGAHYELLEYCEQGSMRALFKGRPMAPEALRTLLTELAGALHHLHGRDIVHRDLKPENVLIRDVLPLDLVLTDFGIASVSQATMHYTSAARTLRYAAPETGSNWVGPASDYWSLGMMLVEALTGRHPFEGMSDAVMANWLVTKPIDLAAVTDERWRMLLRGLLARDPAARWGHDQIARWIAGDATLAAPAEEAATTVGEARGTRPYRIGDVECRTPRELANALARHWALGAQDLQRGLVRAWLQNELHDQELTRFAIDLAEMPGCSDDERLLRLLLRLDPELPPVFRGLDVSPDGLAALAAHAQQEDGEARQALQELVERDLLSLFPSNALHACAAAIRDTRAAFDAAVERALAGGAPRHLRPEGQEWPMRLTFLAVAPTQVDPLRTAAKAACTPTALAAGWFAALAGDADHAGAGALAALVYFGPVAAEQGLADRRAQARADLERMRITVEGGWRAKETHEEAFKALAAEIDVATGEAAVLALGAKIAAFGQSMRAALDAVFAREVFESRPVDDSKARAEVRARISSWASWRGGDAFALFGQQIDLLEVVERRGYAIELHTQIERRDRPYRYSESDVARMPVGARDTVADAWACAMPALTALATDLTSAGGGRAKHDPQVRCPRCSATGRVDIDSGWGAAAYLFSTTFACHNKVGVRVQTRARADSVNVPPAGVPDFVRDYMDSQAREDAAPAREIVTIGQAIDAATVAGIPPGPVRDTCLGCIEEAKAECSGDERVTRQRLRLRWSRFTEVRYRYRDREYTVWVPARTDREALAIDHPIREGGATEPTAAAASRPEPVAADRSNPAVSARPAGAPAAASGARSSTSASRPEPAPSAAASRPASGPAPASASSRPRTPADLDPDQGPKGRGRYFVMFAALAALLVGLLLAFVALFRRK